MDSSRNTAHGLAFKPHLKAEIAPGQGAYLVSEQGVTALRGTGVAALVPLLDGTRDLEQLKRDASPAVPGEQAGRLVSLLSDAGLLCLPDTPDQGDAAERAFWELAGLDGDAAVHRMRRSRVAALAVGSADGQGLRTALDKAGLRVADASGGPQPETALSVVLCEDYLDPALREIDAEHRAAGRPWLPVRLHGNQPWIGPFLRPGEGPCWRCLADQLRRNRQAETYVGRLLGHPVSAPRSCLLAGHGMGLQLAALEASKWLAGYRYPGQEAIWTLDSLQLAGRHHAVRRRPQCPSCGDPELVARRVREPLELRSRPKAAQGSAGDRWLTPDQMLERYGHLVDPLTGVVKEIRRDTRGPRFLNCFHAGHNPVTDPSGLASVRRGLRSHSSGKGTSEQHARISAMCEAIERHSGWFQGDEPTLRATFTELADADDRAVHPDLVQLFHPRQYAGRERWNAVHTAAHRVPEPFDENAPLDWTPVWSLTERTHRLLPTSLLYYNAPESPGSAACLAHSNGSAAGSCVEDAVVQGFLELVERDAVGLWWYNRTRQAGVDLDSFDDPWVAQVRSAHRGLGREVWVLDVSSDLGIPVFAALSRRVDKPAEDITLGFGAHFDPRTALRRALAELNQMLPPVVGARADGSGYACDDPAALAWWREATAANLPYLVPASGGRARTAADFPYEQRPDLLDDLRFVEELVRRHGMELLVLDQTRPDLGVPVVKVIVPGLRTFWTRFGPGRLYDVPVRLGRLETPTAYEDLNPVPLFL
ncbi:TOMM precursor leader peptide-binding protein [Streptomyces sp. KLOTTS4A1]|uniref:TOMM precursor leader peptide-binding protein n=1 Tax=Streptomyces sp. KLOTTS4A1 TaxID=3390996 RepID=UPI0039F55015